MQPTRPAEFTDLFTDCAFVGSICCALDAVQLSILFSHTLIFFYRLSFPAFLYVTSSFYTQVATVISACNFASPAWYRFRNCIALQNPQWFLSVSTNKDHTYAISMNNNRTGNDTSKIIFFIFMF